MDFGLAKMLAATQSLTQTGTVLGTPTYMAPEQWRGGAVDARTDEYALGVIVYEMVLGRTPFESDTPFTLMYKHLNETPPPLHTALPDLPQAVEDVIFQALAKEPEKRYPSAGALAQAFADVVRVAGSLVAKARLETSAPKDGRAPGDSCHPFRAGAASARHRDSEAPPQLTISELHTARIRRGGARCVRFRSHRQRTRAACCADSEAAEVIEAPAAEELQPVIAPAEFVEALLTAPATESQPQIAALVEEKSPAPSGEESQPAMRAAEHADRPYGRCLLRPVPQPSSRSGDRRGIDAGCTARAAAQRDHPAAAAHHAAAPTDPAAGRCWPAPGQHPCRSACARS